MGLLHFLKQTVVVKLMTVLDLLSFTHLNLLLEALSTLTKRTTKKKQFKLGKVVSQGIV